MVARSAVGVYREGVEAGVSDLGYLGLEGFMVAVVCA